MKPAALHDNPEVILQNLIRFDTTNPPGNESMCVKYVQGLLTKAGIKTIIVGKTPKRQNLIARLKGQGKAPPLLLYGHADVVGTTGQKWKYPPFEGKIADGYVWGRGALDMKGGIAMLLAAFLRVRAEKLLPAGDIILAIVCDEEEGSDYGARYLVENHAQLFDGTKFALGEFGGFTLYIGGKKFYPIQVAEKQVCWLKATIRGPAGHGAFPMRGGAMAKLGEVLTLLNQNRLPVHVTPAVRQMCNTMASALPFPAGLVMRQLLHPRLTDMTLKLLGNRGKSFDPLLHNTVNATIVRGGDKTNVIPSEIHLEMDGRLLPGFGPADLISEIRQIIGNTAELEVLRHDPSPMEPDMGLFDLLAGVLREADPDGIPVPLVLSAFTDARLFARLGIQTYGFIPMNLPADFNFTESLHAADERIPVDSVKFGADAIYKVLQRYGR